MTEEDKYTKRAREILEQWEKAEIMPARSVDGTDYTPNFDCWDTDNLLKIMAKALREASEPVCKEEAKTLHKESVCKVVSEPQVAQTDTSKSNVTKTEEMRHEPKVDTYGCKSARQIAEMLVSRYLQANSVASVGGITATLNNWVSGMRAREKKAEPQVMNTREQIEQISKDDDFYVCCPRSYEEGFRKAQSMNATMELGKEMTDEKDRFEGVNDPVLEEAE